MQKTIDYCQKFSKFTSRKTVKDIRTLFPTEVFHQFEIAQLANLCVESAEEALVLIPSLQGHNEDMLQQLLNDLQNLKKTQGA
jgi:DNA-directed RNA polymerase II subunit RPB4